MSVLFLLERDNATTATFCGPLSPAAEFAIVQMDEGATTIYNDRHAITSARLEQNKIRAGKYKLVHRYTLTGLNR